LQDLSDLLFSGLEAREEVEEAFRVSGQRVLAEQFIRGRGGVKRKKTRRKDALGRKLSTALHLGSLCVYCCCVFLFA